MPAPPGEPVPGPPLLVRVSLVITSRSRVLVSVLVQERDV